MFRLFSGRLAVIHKLCEPAATREKLQPDKSEIMTNPFILNLPIVARQWLYYAALSPSVTMATEFPGSGSAAVNTNEFLHTELVNNNDMIGKCKDRQTHWRKKHECTHTHTHIFQQLVNTDLCVSDLPIKDFIEDDEAIWGLRFLPFDQHIGGLGRHHLVGHLIWNIVCFLCESTQSTHKPSSSLLLRTSGTFNTL